VNSPNPLSVSPPADKPPRKFTEPPRDFLRDPLQVGISIVGVTAAFGGGGWWLDTRIGSFPIFMFIGAVLGLFGAIYSIIVRLRAQDRQHTKRPSTKS
jgi:F0F1-type ATP synthase assembly protein I